MSLSDEELKFLRGDQWEEWASFATDQRRGVPVPDQQKPLPAGAPRVDLPGPETFSIGGLSVLDALRLRRSWREYTDAPLSLEELAFLCWATQGVREVQFEGRVSLRTAPSGGARHPFETYLAVQRVAGLEPGLYRYLPLDHQLGLERRDPDLAEKVGQVCTAFARSAAIVFIWTAIPYRTAWRYGPLAPKLIAQDAGHLCENLYLACTAIGAGTCAVGAYHQHGMDALVGVDGRDEFVIYSAPVGKVK